MCTIKKVIGQYDKDCYKVALADSEITVLTKKVTQPVILIPLPQRACNENWDYARSGDDWECECKEGKEQSPIDLPPKEKAQQSPVKPIFQYEEVDTKNLKIVLEDGLLKIKNKNFGKIVTLDGSIFKAEEIRFHTPSEHKIGGKVMDMEMQIIHTGQTKGDIAKQVVLSFLFEKKPGSYNKFIDDVDFFNLPNPQMKSRDIVNKLYIPKILYGSDSEDFPVMKPFSFYTYEGSLTAPPCSERTIHYVASKPIPTAGLVLQLFKEAGRLPDMMDSAGNIIINTNLSMNARKIQPTNGRNIYYFSVKEVVGPEPEEPVKPKPEGHYEKVNRKMTQYFYVNDEVPSGLPGAFVVSESEAKGKK
jgi:carbonic anhydrase